MHRRESTLDQIRRGAPPGANVAARPSDVMLKGEGRGPGRHLPISASMPMTSADAAYGRGVRGWRRRRFNLTNNARRGTRKEPLTTTVFGTGIAPPMRTVIRCEQMIETLSRRVAKVKTMAMNAFLHSIRSAVGAPGRPQLRCVGAKLAVATCLVLHAAFAQSPALPQFKEPSDDQGRNELEIARSSDPGKQPFFRNLADHEWAIWSSPFRKSSYGTNTLRKYGIPFALIATTLIATDNRIEDHLPDSHEERVWSRRVSRLGAAYTTVAISGAMYAFGQMSGNKHARETGWLGLEAIAHTQLVIFGVKQITNRRRPLDDESRGGLWSGGDSFPSGHAATSFALATVVAYEYRDRIAVPIAAYSLAALISGARVTGRKHWVSDIFVGGSTGFLIGRYIYRARHNPELPGSPVGRGAGDRFLPEIGFARGGPTLTWTWR